MATNENDWLEYEWRHEGVLSLTSIDARYHGNKDLQADYSLLMRYSIVSTGKHSLFARWKIDRVIKKTRAAAARSSAYFVGTRALGGVLELYLYGHVEDGLHYIASQAKSVGVYADYIIWSDPQWDTYEYELYPNSAQMQTIFNEQLCERLEAHGDDLVSARRINHYCSFPNEISRLGFESGARNAGFALDSSFYSPESDYPHCCCVRNMSSIDKPSIDALTTKLISIAEEFSGRYDYWDCPIMHKARTKNTPVRKH